MPFVASLSIINDDDGLLLDLFCPSLSPLPRHSLIAGRSFLEPFRTAFLQQPLLGATPCIRYWQRLFCFGAALLMRTSRLGNP